MLQDRDSGQAGYILISWVLVVLVISMFMFVPVVAALGTSFLNTGWLEDQTRRYYTADAQVHAIMEDLKRGADAAPLPPATYTPPSVNLGPEVPSVAVSVVESQTLSTVSPIKYRVAGDPTLLQGFSPSGGGLDLAEDDDSYYKVTSTGDPPVVIWEVTSQVIQFPSVVFGEVQITAASTKGGTKLEVFFFNPNDPNNTDNGYSTVADLTEILDVANVEETNFVALKGSDIQYLNSLSTKTFKIKVKATRTGGFRLDTERIVFSIAGVVTSDKRDLSSEPSVQVGTLMSGTASDLKSDDVSYLTLKSSNQVIVFEATSDNFTFSQLDGVSVPLVVRSNSDGAQVEMYVFNPTDPAHTNGGYDPVPDLIIIIPLKNTDKAMSLKLSSADITYLNSLFPISMKVKIRVTHTTEFQLEVDHLVFIATSVTAPAQIVDTKQVIQQYFDPGLKTPAIAQMAGKEGYLLRVYNVHPGVAKVNWAAHPADFKEAKKTVMVFRGLVLDSGAVVPPGRITTIPPSQDNDLVLSTKSRPGEVLVQTDFFEVDDGLYTIVLFNESFSTLLTEPFAATGDKADTWVYMPAFKDYLVDVRVEQVGLKAVVRQVPGPTEAPAFPWSTTNINWIRNTIIIKSWEPYGVKLP